MGNALQHRVEIWKKQLLDLGKRNRLINFKEGKRNNVRITSPTMEEVYNLIVGSERSLSFPYAKQVRIDENGEESYDVIISGDLNTNRALGDLQKTLRALRLKAKTSIEEQGINILHLTFGSIQWRESESSDVIITSPLILVPVSLTIASASSPFVLSLHEDEIVVNPSLVHKFEADFGLHIPEFDSTQDDIVNYLNDIEELVSNKGWTIAPDINLTILSFLKINMYKDLDRHEEKLNNNLVISTIAGESDSIEIPSDLNNYDHDSKTKPIDTYQVVDADSSQQDAILLSKAGTSFVLQGPPGTGKSQTITNIISEALADGKKVLFVSEKMAALQVVYNRLSSIGLADFCFALHSHKAKKKDILRDLANSINIDRKRVRDEILVQLDNLEKKREKLNEYQNELHTECSGLNCSIYNVNGKLAKLSHVPDIIFTISNVGNITQSELNDRCYLLEELSTTIGKRSEDYKCNVWRNSSVDVLTNELRHDIDANFSLLIPQLEAISDTIGNGYEGCLLPLHMSLDNILVFIEIYKLASESPLLPVKWIYCDDINALQQEAGIYLKQEERILKLKEALLDKYAEDMLQFEGESIKSKLATIASALSKAHTCGSAIEIEDIQQSDLVNSTIINDINALNNQAALVASAIGLNKPTTIKDIEFIIAVSNGLSTPIKPTKQWFSNKNLNATVLEHKTLHDNLKAQISDVITYYNDGIFSSSLLEEAVVSLSQVQTHCATLSKRLDAEIYNSKYDIIDKSSSISQVIEEVLPYLIDITTKANNIALNLNIAEPTSYLAINRFVQFCKGLQCKYGAKSAWFESEKANSYRELFDRMESVATSVLSLKQNILSKYDNDIFDIDILTLVKRFRSQYSSVLRVFNKDFRQDIATIKSFSHTPKDVNYKSAFELLNQIKAIKDKEQEILEESTKLTMLLGDRYCGVQSDWLNIKSDYNQFRLFVDEFADLCVSNKVHNILLNQSSNNESIQELIELYSESKFESIQHSITQLTAKTSTYIPNLLKILEEIKNSASVVTEEYCNILSLTSIQQRSDSCNEISSRKIVELIGSLSTISDARKEIERNNDLYNTCYGDYYNGLDTDWQTIQNDLDCLNRLAALFATTKIPYKLKELLLSQELSYDQLSELSQSRVTCQGIVDRFNDLYLDGIDININIEQLSVILNDSANRFSELLEIYNKCTSICNCSRTYLDVCNDIDELVEMQSLISDLKSKEDALKIKFENYFGGENTNWNEAISALKYAGQLKAYVEKYNLSRDFVELVCQDSNMIADCRKRYETLDSLYTNSTTYVEWALSLFEDTKMLRAQYVKDLACRLNDCRNSKQLLEEWVDYRTNKRKCESAGLTEYILQIEEQNIPAHLICDSYLKRFYRLWLDIMLPQFPSVLSFRGRIQDQTIKEFKELDRYQFTVARSRVRERVISRIPDFNSITTSKDEIGVLKRELNKQRKIMPLRKLFKTIPNLITAIRPCFMMSPLSVSLFLEADSYEFDMVIFDEASQVHTEDAIGAIMRGKQVIIVGDTKQLPPTNFFATTISDDGYDSEDESETEDEEAGAYQSILDESVAILPERSLRWHYRSRHEDLISFSNFKIYNSSLITFPSSIEKAKDCGVEYVHVSNGVYDRGKKRCNIIEAKKVAELVIKHYKQYPERSLGVVTFSEAQMQAVDGAIRHLRQSNPSYDRYFAEDRDEPFFIKNIENVQGDERDTIIFSIGYARDVNGTISMNFGALNKEGGHRRLNVAITRAKHNVKLVGSIVPTDIDIDKTNAEGVRLLRSYIEFAQQGIAALQKELSYGEALDFDSPFEEAVYDFLVSKGYSVTTQVGCSGFRIDMAVKHPTKSGLFAIGIECDGATYHSSRTARERDRLRQEVLENMGWKIHRIWSTDWIKDQKSEEEKLLIAVEKALGNVPNDTLFGDDADLATSDTHIDLANIEEVVVDNQETCNASSYGFIPYTQGQIGELIGIGTTNIIKKIIEIEQPIHFDELCKRVAPIYGNQKATVKIRTEVERQFKNSLKFDIQREGDFISLIYFDNLQVRVPNELDGYIRNIIHISPEELALAMKTIAEHSFGITPEDLFVVTARELGFRRTSENIATTLRSVYAQMCTDGVVREVDGKVSVLS